MKKPVATETTDSPLESILNSKLERLRKQVLLKIDDPAELSKINEEMRVLTSIGRLNKQTKEFLNGGR
ncbi:hypothetical protein [Methylocystis sp. Sn-Cys]|uniref:hypothetical protein n=1 Tax=Methylocystis sp. Sn-Cys TaxID=1701263 RepID=UPI001924CAE0|nr:hypothetical protein [Methylocystis sp. Sn-Cys]MBL1258619.1 hypothetical protein [Methylocystis sp. Sn-Cys]